MIGFGLSEVYNRSFISRKDLEKSAGDFFGHSVEKVLNPVSAEFAYLRPSLSSQLLKNIDDNLRFFNEVKIFELGHVFSPEKKLLGLALGHKKEITLLELKGLADELLERVGLAERHYTDLNFTSSDRDIPFLNQRESLRIESDHQVIGYIGAVNGSGGRQAVAEIDLEKLGNLIEAEREYRPMAKYPSIMRDISLLAPRRIRAQDIQNAIEAAAPQYLDDVDLIDFYENEKELGESFKSLTFRMVFLAEDRTLTDEEADKEVQKISSALIKDLGIEIR